MGYYLHAYKFDATKLIACDSKESAYVLGFLWADAYIYVKRHFTILEIIKSDFDNISNLFQNWTISYRNRKNRQPQARAQTSNGLLYDFLVQHNYLNKSGGSPSSIINHIPEQYRSYWYLGYIDGDGSWYTNYKNSCNHIHIGSTYDQDWNFMLELGNQLDIYFGISRRIAKNGNKSSIVRCSNLEEIKKIQSYLYPNGYEIGLKRKFDKSIIIQNTLKRKPGPKPK